MEASTRRLLRRAKIRLRQTLKNESGVVMVHIYRRDTSIRLFSVSRVGLKSSKLDSSERLWIAYKTTSSVMYRSSFTTEKNDVCLGTSESKTFTRRAKLLHRDSDT